MKKVGIMGGTFNPIHMGHLMLAESAREEYELDEVWFIPTGHSYMKEGGTKDPLSTDRLEMTKIAVESNPYFRCLDIEVLRQGNTYTYETLEELKRLYPGVRFYFIFGADCLFEIERWKEPGRIFAASDIIAAVRDDFDTDVMQGKIKELRAKYEAKIHFLPFRELEISSTEIRQRVHEGESIRYMVPDGVRCYIEEKGFYGE